MILSLLFLEFSIHNPVTSTVATVYMHVFSLRVERDEALSKADQLKGQLSQSRASESQSLQAVKVTLQQTEGEKTTLQ